MKMVTFSQMAENKRFRYPDDAVERVWMFDPDRDGRNTL